jgi:hypothetical protein
MKIKSKITTEVEKEITLPYFCKSSDYNYTKVVSNDLVIKVNTYPFSTSIDIASLEITSIGNDKSCSEDEFNAAFGKAFNSIANLQTSLV